jgi:hypothetical protein
MRWLTAPGVSARSSAAYFILPGARHGDKRLQQREAPDHDASLAQLNLIAKSVAC